MIDWFSITVYALCGAILVMMSAGILLSAFMPALSRWNRRYFIMLFTILLLYAVVLTIDMVIYNLPGLMTEKRILIIIEFLLFSMLVPMPMPFLLHSCGEFKRDSIPLRAVIMLWILFCLMFTRLPSNSPRSKQTILYHSFRAVSILPKESGSATPVPAGTKN